MFRYLIVLIFGILSIILFAMRDCFKSKKMKLLVHFVIAVSGTLVALIAIDFFLMLAQSEISEEFAVSYEKILFGDDKVYALNNDGADVEVEVVDYMITDGAEGLLKIVYADNCPIIKYSRNKLVYKISKDNLTEILNGTADVQLAPTYKRRLSFSTRVIVHYEWSPLNDDIVFDYGNGKVKIATENGSLELEKYNTVEIAGVAEGLYDCVLLEEETIGTSKSKETLFIKNPK